MATQRPLTSPQPRRHRGGDDGFDSNLRDFIHETELKAKRIMKTQTLKHNERVAKVCVCEGVVFIVLDVVCFGGDLLPRRLSLLFLFRRH